MKTTHRIGTVLRSGTAITAIAIAALTAAPAWAQESAATTVDPTAAAAVPAANPNSDIVVTGTRISGVTNASGPGVAR